MMTVGEYTKHGEGMGSFVSYKVNVKVRTSTPFGPDSVCFASNADLSLRVEDQLGAVPQERVHNGQAI